MVIRKEHLRSRMTPSGDEVVANAVDQRMASEAGAEPEEIKEVPIIKSDKIGRLPGSPQLNQFQLRSSKKRTQHSEDMKGARGGQSRRRCGSTA